MAAPIFILELVVLLGAFQGTEHPVPLAPDIDAAKCVECHTDKQEGKHVHTAVSAIGCTGCHQVETKNDITTVHLTAPPAELCITCHEEIKEENKHKPYADHKCILCHDPHATDFPKQTRAATNALCLECHRERQASDKVEIFRNFTLNQEEFSQIPKIVLDKKEQTGHPFVGHPVSGGRDPVRKDEPLTCLSCHEHHAAPLPELLSAQYKDVAVCENCHQAAEALKAGKAEEPPKPAATPKPHELERNQP